MKVVLLAGGFGTRISEESQYKPKPMIEIGGMPILWHIMNAIAFMDSMNLSFVQAISSIILRSGSQIISFILQILPLTLRREIKLLFITSIVSPGR